MLGHVADTEEHPLSDALYGVPLVALYGGVAMFLLANVAFKWRALRSSARSGWAPPSYPS